MSWYYVDQGKQAGPVDDAQLEQMRSSGQIQEETLIWQEGMENWKPYRDAKGGGGMPPPPASAAGAPAAAGGLRLSTSAPTVTTTPPEAVCTECGNMFQKENMIRYGNNWVCANCKPVFMQKVAEGAQLNTGAMRYAGFWIRFAARFIDGILLFVVNMAVNLMFGLGIAGMSRSAPNAALGLQLVVSLINMSIALSYETFMVGTFGATLGKMACRLQVVTADGGKVSYLRALGRYFSLLLSYFICTIGFIIAAFDDEKRALHDHICSTRVVYKDSQ